MPNEKNNANPEAENTGPPEEQTAKGALVYSVYRTRDNKLQIHQRMDAQNPTTDPTLDPIMGGRHLFPADAQGNSGNTGNAGANRETTQTNKPARKHQSK